MPGAVPTGFSMLTAPAGTSACWRFDGDIVLPMRAKRRSSPANSTASRPSGRPGGPPHAFPVQVVVVWAEAAADDDDVRSAERRAQHRFDLGHVVADRGV